MLAPVPADKRAPTVDAAIKKHFDKAGMETNVYVSISRVQDGGTVSICGDIAKSKLARALGAEIRQRVILPAERTGHAVCDAGQFDNIGFRRTINYVQ